MRSESWSWDYLENKDLVLMVYCKIYLFLPKNGCYSTEDYSDTQRNLLRTTKSVVTRRKSKSYCKQLIYIFLTILFQDSLTIIKSYIEYVLYRIYYIKFINLNESQEILSITTLTCLVKRHLLSDNLYVSCLYWNMSKN